MFGKSLILVLFACALALANPIQNNEQPALQPNYGVNIGSWLQDAHEGIKQTFKWTVQPFEKTYYSLVEAGKNGQEYSKDKIEQLRSAFHEITDKGREQLSDIEVVVLTNTIGNLQSAVEYLSTRPNIQVGHEDQNLQEIVSNKQNNANDKIDQLKNSVWHGINGAGQSVNNMGQHAQGLFNGQVESMKPNHDGGFTLGNGAFSKFRDDENVNRAQNDYQNQFSQLATSGVTIGDKLGGGAHSTLNDGATGFFNNLGNSVQGAIGNGVENLKQWGSGAFKFGEGISDKFGNQAQDAINNGIHGAQNQINQYVPSTNGAKSYQDNVYDSRLTLDNIGRQLAGTVAVHMNNVEQGLLQWRSIAENFLANGKNKVEQQAQAVNEGMGHFQVKSSKFPNVAEGMNNIQGSFGQLPSIVNIQDKMGQFPNAAEGIDIKGNFGQYPNYAAQGINKIQESVGQLTNAAEGINAQGNFGQYPNFAAEGINKIKGGFGKFPDFVGGIVNMPGATGHMPEIDEGISPPENAPTDDGRFSKVGQTVGGNIGKGIDKFTNAFGGMWRNTVGMLGK